MDESRQKAINMLWDAPENACFVLLVSYPKRPEDQGLEEIEPDANIVVHQCMRGRLTAIAWTVRKFLQWVPEVTIAMAQIVEVEMRTDQPKTPEENLFGPN